MATNKEYFDFVLELLRETDGITYKKMMGEYILFKDGIIFGGVYDNRFLVKKTDSIETKDMKEQIPYPSAKPMLLVDSEDSEEVKTIVESVIKELRK